MMKYFAVVLLLIGSALGCAPAQGQADPERSEQILANLQLRFPQLQEYEVTMGPFEETSIDGLMRGSFTVGGQQTQAFLVTDDNTQLYLIGGDPVDVSMPLDAVEAELAEADAAAAREAATREEQLLTALPELPELGSTDAPVTIVEFSDFQCPYCARGARTVQQIYEKYGDDVRFIFAHYPLPNHDWARPAAIAAECAADQDEDAFWALHDAYFENQRALSTDNLIAQSRTYLADSGLDLDTWQACAADASTEAHQAAAAIVQQTEALGRQFGVTGTPAFFVNGHFVSGAQPLPVFEEYIRDAVAN